MTNELSKRLVMCEKCAHKKGDICVVHVGPSTIPCICAAYKEAAPKESSDPDHYKFGDIECIDAMRACSTKEEFRAHLKLVIMKYLWRLGRKDDPKIEAEKIKVYAGWLVDNENDDPLRKQK